MIKKIQHFFQRRQIDKSIQALQKTLELNPKDTRTLLKLGDLFAKAGKPPEAIEQYIASAEIFAEAGFQLKSIALYKQILKLNPESISAHRRLAQLTFQHGLLADALQYYRDLVDCLRRSQTEREAVDIFEAISQLDLRSFSVKLVGADAIFAGDARDKDPYVLLCSRLSHTSADPTTIEDMKSVVQWLCDRYPRRWEAYELLASLTYKHGDKESLELAVSKLEGVFKELGLLEEKKDVVSKYKEKAALYESMLESLTETPAASKDSARDQVKIKMEVNIYDILKRKAQETSASEGDALPQAREGEISQRIGFDELFQNFKQDLQTKVGKGDYETHFNLGIAYHEMGLHEDAIKEFEIALEDPRFGYDCHYMIGQSLMALNRPEEAVAVYEKGMNLDGLDPERLLGLKYELALALLEIGRNDEALYYFKEISALRGDYRDVLEQIRTLTNSAVS